VGATTPDKQFGSDYFIADLNGMLFDKGHEDVKLSAARYTRKGNLVLTAHHTTTQLQLNTVAPTLKTFMLQIYKNSDITPPTEHITTRANVKWSKVLINSVPVGINSDRGPWTPEECHRSLVAHNPSYAALQVTQKPSWVRTPSTLKENAHSSLVVAFEDPDGSARRSLLTKKQLYILGVGAKVSKWKERTRTNPTTPPQELPSDPSISESRASTPDAVMAEEPRSPTPTTVSRKHLLPPTPSKPKPSSSPKKKRVGPA
jgi:hypothetical protein